MNIFMAVATITGNTVGSGRIAFRVRQLNDTDFYFVVFKMMKLGRAFRKII